MFMRDEAPFLPTHSPRTSCFKWTLARSAAEEESYKWILYGDDDTVFFVDNVLSMLSMLDHRQPYLLSDCLWWPQGGRGGPCTDLSMRLFAD